MTKLKISVIRTFSPKDVFGHEYKTPTGEVAQKCFLNEGQSWIIERDRMPEDFCSWAWEDLRMNR
ncbi:MAG: TIGR04076 family protein, partial [Candidatus Thorarchaeota archaeon]